MRWLALLLFVACSHEPAPEPLPANATNICEGCVGELSGIRVGVADIYERSLPAPDGGPAAMRMSVMLALWNPSGDDGGTDHVYVVEGSTVTIGGDGYRVLRIDDPRGRHGSIALVPATSR